MRGRGKLGGAVVAQDSRIAIMVALGVACALLLCGHARAAAYKWTDDKGVVHYSDHIPAEAVNKGSVMLDKQGRAVQKTEPALTPDQLREKRVDDDRQRALLQKQEEQGRRDRALLSSYSSEEEIDLARNRAISTIDSQLKSAQGYTSELARRRQELETKRLEYGNKPVPVALERELSGIDEEVLRQNALVGQKRQDMASVAGRYDLEKQRWRELRSQDFVLAPAVAPTPAADAAKSGPVASPGTAKKQNTSGSYR
jgi:hypothetical protein